MKTTSWFCVALAVATLATSAGAQVSPGAAAPSPLVVDVTESAAGFDAAAIRAAVGEELHRPAVAPTMPLAASATVLTVVLDASGRLVAIYHAPGERDRVRALAAPGTAADVPPLVALMAADLARGELAPTPPSATPPRAPDARAAERARPPEPRPPARPPPDPFWARFGGHLALYATAGLAWTDGPAYSLALQFGIGYRWDRVVLALEGGYATPIGATAATQTNLTSVTFHEDTRSGVVGRWWWVTPVARLQHPVGPVMLELAGGLGVINVERRLLFRASSTGFLPMNLNGEQLIAYTAAAARVGVGAALRVTGWLDLIARADLISALPPSAPGGVLATTTLGVQGRFVQ